MNNLKLNRITFNPIRKSFTWFLAVIFILNIMPTEILSARADSRAEAVITNAMSLDVETVTIPMHLGDIKYAHKGRSEKVIVHIQDAHCNEYAQHKISDLIDYLNKEYGIEVVNLEGGVGPYDLDVFTSISGEAIRREVADYFVKTGEINGAEFYAINNPEAVVLWGIENKDLYIKNLQVYRDSLKYKKAVEKLLRELTHLLNNLKRHIFNQDLLKIDIAYNTYKSGNKEFKDYLYFLVKRAKESAIQVRDYPNLYLLSQSLEKENEVDFNKANVERNILIDELKKSLSRNEVRELVTKTIEFKTKKISRKVFYNYIYEKAKEVNVETKRFPQLSSYVVYVALYEAVDRYKVMSEMDDLEAAIKDPFYENEVQRELNILSKTLALTKNIFAITLTKDDYRYYLANKDLFEIENYIRFIDREKSKYRITAQVSSDIADLNGYLESIVKFYEYSFDRDEVFLKNMKFDIPVNENDIPHTVYDIRKNANSAIMVTGGFHTENLCELLDKADFSYISILPKFINPNDYQTPYFDLLAGQTTNLQSMLTSVIAKTAMMQIASHLNSTLGEAVYDTYGMGVFDLSVRIVTRMVEIKKENNDNVTVVLGDRENGKERITSIGTGSKKEPVDINDILRELFPGSDDPEPRVKEDDVDTKAKAKLSDNDALIIKNLNQTMNFAKKNVFVNSETNTKYANAYTEQYAVHETMKRIENDKSIVVVTAETSTFSDLNRWGHAEVDTIRDEFGGNFGRLLNEKKSALKDIGIEFIGFYNPYGGRWHYMFSSVGEYNESDNNRKEFAKALEEILGGATKAAKTKIPGKFKTETNRFNVNLGISKPFKKMLENRPTPPKNREEILRRKIKDIVFRFAEGKAEKEEWDKFLKDNPSLSDIDIIEKVFDQRKKDIIAESLGFRKESWKNKDKFRKNYLEYVENETDAEYYKEVINDAIYDSHNMLAYAENEYFAQNYISFASREKRGNIDVFDPKIKAPSQKLTKVFSYDRTPKVVRFLRDKDNVKYLKQRKVNPNIPKFDVLDRYVEKLKEKIEKDIEDNGVVGYDLKEEADDFIAKMVDLKIKSRRGVLRGVDVINTVIAKFAEKAKAFENESNLFRLNVDFDYLSRAEEKSGDKIIVEGLSIMEDVFRNKFGVSRVAVIQKGAGDESVVVGYFDGDLNELEIAIEEIIEEVNAKLADLEFDGKKIRYSVPDPEDKDQTIIWKPSISAGLTAFNPKEFKEDSDRKKELEEMDFKAETALNEYVKRNGKRGVISYSNDKVLKERKVVPVSMEAYLPEGLVEYSNALKPYFDDDFVEKQAEELLLIDPRCLVSKDIKAFLFPKAVKKILGEENGIILFESYLAGKKLELSNIKIKERNLNKKLLEAIEANIVVKEHSGDVGPNSLFPAENVPEEIQVDGKSYKVDPRHIGMGGFGYVYKTKNPADGIAVKVLKNENIPQDQKTSDAVVLLREHMISQKLEGVEGVIKTYGVRKYNDNNRDGYYMLMEKADSSLEDYIREQKQRGDISEEKAFSVIKRILSILKEIQEREIIYADLKPENILMKDGELKFADFGNSFVLGENQNEVQVPMIPLVSSRHGTYPYMPARAYKGIYDYRNDRFAAGMLLMRMLLSESEFSDFDIPENNVINPSRMNPEKDYDKVREYRTGVVSRLDEKYRGNILFGIASHLLSDENLQEDKMEGRSWVDQDLDWIKKQEEKMFEYLEGKDRVMDKIESLEGAAGKIQSPKEKLTEGRKLTEEEKLTEERIAAAALSNQAAYLAEMLEKQYGNVMSVKERKEMEKKVSAIRSTEKRTLRMELRDILTNDQIKYFEEMYDTVQKSFFGMSSDAATQNEYHGFWHVMNDVRLTIEGIKRMDMPKRGSKAAGVFRRNALKTLLAGLLHDIGYAQHGVATSNHVAMSIEKAREMLEDNNKMLEDNNVMNFDEKEIDQISSIIALTDISPNSEGDVKKYKEKAKEWEKDTYDLKKMCDILLVADLTGAASMPEYLSMLFPLYREYNADAKNSDIFGSFLQLASGTKDFQEIAAIGGSLSGTLQTLNRTGIEDIAKLEPKDRYAGMLNNVKPVFDHLGSTGLISKNNLNAFRANMNQRIAKVGDIYNALKAEDRQFDYDPKIDSLNDMKEAYLGVSSVLLDREADFDNMIYVFRTLSKVVKGLSLDAAEVASLKIISEGPAFRCDALIALYGDIQNKVKDKIEAGTLSGSEVILMKDSAGAMLKEILDLRARNPFGYGFDNIAEDTSFKEMFRDLGDTVFDPEFAEQEAGAIPITAAAKSPGTAAIKSEELGVLEKIVSGIPSGSHIVTAKEMKAAKDWAGKILAIAPGLNLGKIDNVEVKVIDFSADLKNSLYKYKDQTDALSYKNRKTGNLVIVLNSSIRQDGTFQRRDQDFYNNTKAMGELIVHEYLESIFKTPDGEALSHGKIKNLEMEANGKNALTELNKVLIKHMTLEQLKAIEKGHKTKEEYESDPGDKFYMAVQTEIRVRSLRDVAEMSRQGKYKTTVLVEVSEKEKLEQGTKDQEILNQTSRSMQKDYGINLRAIFCTREEMKVKIEKEKGRRGFDDPNYRMVILANSTGTKDKKFETFKNEVNDLMEGNENKLVGVIPANLLSMTAEKRFSFVSLSVIGMGITDYSRYPSIELAEKIKTALKNVANITENDSMLKPDEFMKKLLDGYIFLDIKKIDYNEIRDYMEAESAVLESL